MSRVGDQLRGHFGWREHVVHEAGRDGVAGHAVELGRLGVLRHRHPACTLHRPQAERPVAAGAGEHDANRALALSRRQRAKEEVDRQSLAARCFGRQQLELPPEKLHVTIGRDDVGAVRPHHHPVLHLEHLHARVAPHELREQALVVRGQVLHQHERHVDFGARGHRAKEGFERRESARGRANADHRKTSTCPARGLVVGGLTLCC
jgi:hypothetical protein